MTELPLHCGHISKFLHDVHPHGVAGAMWDPPFDPGGCARSHPQIWLIALDCEPALPAHCVHHRG